jgi:pimeloyl-ACP methyl ester carboxylesterase
MSGIMGSVDRRRLFGYASAALWLSLAGCQTVPEPPGPDCDPPPVSGVGWIPDVAHPVWFGEEHLTSADGAPRTMTITYPSNRVLPPRQMLRSCLGRWPVVLLLHGQPPSGLSAEQLRTYHRSFGLIAVGLARSGYVVVAPQRTARLPTPVSGPEMLAAAIRDVDWVRNAWSEAKWVSRAPGRVAVVGHSYGGLEAAFIANNWPEVAALVSLSGPWLEPTDAPATFEAIRVPSLFMFKSTPGGFERIEDNPNPAVNFWRTITANTYAAIYAGQHFDYLDASQSGSEPRGPCSMTGRLAADLTALFIAANIQSLTSVPIELRKPAVVLTPEQEPFAVQHLTAIDKPWGPDCRIELKWRAFGQTGQRTIG